MTAKMRMLAVQEREWREEGRENCTTPREKMGDSIWCH